MTSPQAVFQALYDDEEPDAVEAALEMPAEGQEMQVPYRGSVVDILQRIRGHLRSAVSYGGRGIARPAPRRRCCRIRSATSSRSRRPRAPNPTSADRVGL